MTEPTSRQVALGKRSEQNSIYLFDGVFEVFEYCFYNSVFAAINAQTDLSGVVIDKAYLVGFDKTFFQTNAFTDCVDMLPSDLFDRFYMIKFRESVLTLSIAIRLAEFLRGRFLAALGCKPASGSVE